MVESSVHQNSPEGKKSSGFFSKFKEKLRGFFAFNKRAQTENQPKKDEYKKSNEQLDKKLTPKERAVSISKNWVELYQAVDLIDSIPTTSGGELLSREIKKRISQAYHSKNPLESCSLLPRAFGIRQKYIQLLEASFKERDLYDSQQKFIDYGDPRNLKIKDPEQYFSQSVKGAVDRIISQMRSGELSMDDKKELIYIACGVVEGLMPYDYQGLDSGRVSADDDVNVTMMLVKGRGGVCRHQAPFLTAVLKRLGFDAHQVWHEWSNEPAGHTLVYINDKDIKAFVNPGGKHDRSTLMSFHEYERISGNSTYNWRARSNNNTWQELDFEQALAKHRY